MFESEQEEIQYERECDAKNANLRKLLRESLITISMLAMTYDDPCPEYKALARRIEEALK